MKKANGIFVVLLGVIASITSLPAFAADQTVRACIHLGDSWQGAAPWSVVDGVDAFEIAPSSAKVGSGGSATFTATTPKGWKISYWLTGKDVNSVQTLNYPSGYDKVESHDATFVYHYTAGYDSNPAVAVRFDPLVYTNRFVAGEGVTGRMADEGHSYTNVYKLSPCGFTKKGYSFRRWKVQVDTSVNKYFNDKAKVYTGSNLNVRVDGQIVSFNPVWTANVYTVTFDSNGGSTLTPNTKSVTYDQQYGTLPTVTKTGYDFSGWYDYTGTNRIESTTAMKRTKDHTLTAHWTAKTYTIGFSCSGEGSGSVSPSTVSKTYHDTVTVTATPDTGSTFSRWSDGVKTNPRTLTVQSNATYTAYFALKEYSVNFKWVRQDGTPTNQIVKVKYGQGATAPKVEQRIGYDHTGWDVPFSNVKADLEVTAEYVPWQRLITIAKGGEGNGTVSPISKERPYGEVFEAVATPAEDSEFVEWSDGVKTPTRMITVGGEAKTYTAIFKIKSYGVTFNWLVGNAVPTQEVRAVNWGETAQAPSSDAVNSRIGYRWQSWDVAISSVKSNMTVNAIYEANRYRVVFDGNGAEAGVMDPQPFTYDVAQRLDSNVFSRDEELWEFAGWTNRLTGVTYADGETVSNLTALADDTVTLSANWKSLLNDLSIAMKCYNLQWISTQIGTYGVWEIGSDADCQKTSCAQASKKNCLMTANVKKSGMIRIRWKGESDQPKLRLQIGANEPYILEGAPNEWVISNQRMEMPAGEEKSIINLRNTDGACIIDWIKWMPDGSKPEPDAEDRPTMDGMVMTENGLGVRIGNVSGYFDYQLLATNDLTAPMPWPVIKEAAGESTEPILFVVPETEGQPQMFYRARVIQKKEL